MQHIIHNRRCAIAAIAASAGLLAAAPAQAAFIFIPNGNFQTPDVIDGGFTFNTTEVDTSTVPDWTFFGGDSGIITAGVWDPQSVSYTGADGDNAALPAPASGGQTGYIYLSQFDDLNPQPVGGKLTSTVPGLTIANNFKYTLTIALGNAKDLSPGDVTIQMLVNGNVVEDSFVPEGTLVNGAFTDVTTIFQTTLNDMNAGGNLTIAILHSFGGTGEREIEFDNVRLDATFVPDPAGGSTALLGMGALIGSRKRRQRCGTAVVFE